MGGVCTWVFPHSLWAVQTMRTSERGRKQKEGVIYCMGGVEFPSACGILKQFIGSVHCPLSRQPDSACVLTGER